MEIKNSGPARLGFFSLVFFAVGGLAVNGLGFALTIHLPRYFAAHVGLSLAAVGAAFTIVRLIDIGIDPILGMLMDRTKSRFGRYRPWFIMGAPVVMAAAYMLFMAPKGSTEVYLVGWLVVFYLGTSIMGLAHSAWAGSLSGDYNERSRIFGYVQALGLVGSALVMLVPLLMANIIGDDDIAGIHAMGWSMILALPLMTLIASPTKETLRPIKPNAKVNIKEYWYILKKPSVRRIILADLMLAVGTGTLAPIFIFFWRDARGFTVAEANVMLILFMVAGLVGAPFWAKVAQKVGKHRTIILTASCFIMSQTIAVFLPPRSPLVFAALFMNGFFVAAFTLLIRALIADIADEVRLDYGKERSGLLYALVTSTQKVGGAFSVAVTFWILAVVGYVPTEGAANTAENLKGLEWCYTLAPSVFTLAGVLCFIGFPLTAKRHNEIRDELLFRDAALEGAFVLGGVPPAVDPTRGPANTDGRPPQPSAQTT